MPRRQVLTERQREALFGLPTDEPALLHHYVLSDADIKHIQARRRPENRLGFALQVCALRYPGRLLQPGELIPDEIISFVGAQLGIAKELLATYAQRRQTRYQHSASLQKLYGYRLFDSDDSEFRQWLAKAAEGATSNEGLARALVAEMRLRRIVVPAISTVERLCADALVAAENSIAHRVANGLDKANCKDLDSLLTEFTTQRVSIFVWLRQHEAGNNSRVVNGLMDKLERLIELGLDPSILNEIPRHRVARLKRQGERYFADGMRDLPDHRRLAILAVCCIEWRAEISDAIIETHDRVVGKLYRMSERTRNDQVNRQREAIQKTLQTFTEIGAAMVAAQEAGESLNSAIDETCGWEAFDQLVQDAAQINATVSADPLDFVGSGYHRFRRYAPRLLDTLEISGAQSSKPLLSAIDQLRSLNLKKNLGLPKAVPIAFARPKWRKRLHKTDRINWETAILFTLRVTFRSGDVWLCDSRRYAEPSKERIPASQV